MIELVMEVMIMISYDKLFNLLADKGINTTQIREQSLIGQRSYYALKNGTGGLDRKTLDKLCRALDCQPGDLMEYVPDEE